MNRPSQKEIQSFRYLNEMHNQVYQGMYQIFRELPPVEGNASDGYEDHNGSPHRSGLTTIGLVETRRLKFRKSVNDPFEEVEVKFGKDENLEPVVYVLSSQHEPRFVPVTGNLKTDAANIMDVVRLWVAEILK